MNDHYPKWLAIIVAAVVAILVGSLYLAAKPDTLQAPPTPASQVQAPTPPQQPTGPTISWSVSQLTQTLFPGNNATATVIFQSNQNLNGVNVNVTPSLDGIVSVSPAKFPNVEADQPYQVTMKLTAPPVFMKRTFGGAIQLRNAGQAPSTYGPPLNVGLTIDFLTYNDPTFAINVPTDWISASETPSADDPTNPVRLVSFSLQTDPVPVLYILLYPHGSDIPSQAEEPPGSLGTNSQFDFYFQMRSAPVDPAALGPGLTAPVLQQELLQAITTFKVR